MQVVEKQPRHGVLLLGVQRDLVRVHPAEVVKRAEQFRQQTERQGDGVILGDVVQTAFDEFHPYQTFHVVAKQTGQRFFSLVGKTVGKLRKEKKSN